jgi:hypothetical protein
MTTGTAQSSTITFDMGAPNETFDVAWYDTATVNLSGNSDPLEIEDNDMFMVIIDEIL